MSKKAVVMEITGVDELKDTLERIAPREGRNILRAAVHNIAIRVRDVVRQRAPKASGTLRKAITAQRRRGKPNNPVSEVRVRHGKGEKYDAWYWHMVERGTVKQPAQQFIFKTVKEFRPQLPRLYKQEFGRQFVRNVARKARKANR